jgi:hypothetical protein
MCSFHYCLSPAIISLLVHVCTNTLSTNSNPSAHTTPPLTKLDDLTPPHHTSKQQIGIKSYDKQLETPSHATMPLLILLLALVVVTHALPLQAVDITSRAIQSPFLSDVKSLAWLNTVTFSLICYDVLVGALFCWMWVWGYLRWMARGGAREMETAEMQRQRERRRGRHTLMEGEMRKLGMI